MSITSSVVTKDRRVEDLRGKLNGVDFGVNMDGYSRTRIAQVVLAVLDADREEIARDLERKAVDALAAGRTNGPYYSDTHSNAAIRQADSLRDAALSVRLHRDKAPEISERDLWKAGQPTKDWLNASMSDA